MKKSDFYFELPEELIAQTPIERRDHSRLLSLDRKTGQIRHGVFYDFPFLLQPGDCLVLNDSRVLPARLTGARESGAEAELVLLRDLGGRRWECLARPGRRIRVGARLIFGDGQLTGRVMDLAMEGNRIVEFEYEGVFLELLERLGRMPLPAYIKTRLSDSERYQTVYSRQAGSAAAPTAGLHFTRELLEEIRGRGISTAFITLHVGLGTFRPVKTENIEDHKMHSEYCVISPEAAKAVNDCKLSGGRVVAVGTTSCRTLESFASREGLLTKASGFTDIFIRPGYQFQCVDALLTNFHLPESTLIMLVSALAGRERVIEAYREAIREGYRFYSFGDAMFIS